MGSRPNPRPRRWMGHGRPAGNPRPASPATCRQTPAPAAPAGRQHISRRAEPRPRRCARSIDVERTWAAAASAEARDVGAPEQRPRRLAASGATLISGERSDAHQRVWGEEMGHAVRGAGWDFGPLACGLVASPGWSRPSPRSTGGGYVRGRAGRLGRCFPCTSSPRTVLPWPLRFQPPRLEIASANGPFAWPLMRFPSHPAGDATP